MADITKPSSLKALHDLLLGAQPEGATHDVDACPVCSDDQEAAVGYTEEELNAKIAAAVAEAVAAKDARIAELEAAKATDDIKAAVAEATSELASKVEDLQAELDEAAKAVRAAQDERDAVIAYLTEVAEQERKAALTEERLKAVKDTKVYPDEYVDAHPERWVEMSDEAFAAEIAALKASPAAKATTDTGSAGSNPLPGQTAMTATAAPGATGSTGGGTDPRSVVGSVIRLRTDRIDVNRIPL